MSQPTDPNAPEPPRLKFLRWLVIILTVTMIVGLITIVTLIVMTFMRTKSTKTALPTEIALPASESAQAFTKGSDWHAIVTKDSDGNERIHILDPKTGEIRQTILIKPIQ